MNKKYYISIKDKNYIDNKRNDFLLFEEKSLEYVKDVLSLSNKYKILVKSNN